MLKLAGETDSGIIEQHERSLNAHLPETLAVLLRGANYHCFPTNAGWTTSHAGSGNAVQDPGVLYVATGATANSRAMLYSLAYGFNVDQPGHNLLNWDKKLYLVFNYYRVNSDAQCTARVQIKQANTEGALAVKGIGIQVSNLALYGESCGAAQATVDLNTSLTSARSCQVVLIHYPGSKIEWYINGVLKGTQSNAANIPSGLSTTTTYLLHSVVNGAAGGTDCNSTKMQPKIWQER